MEKFATIFEDEKYGQILVMRDQNDDGDPCIKFSALPPGLGVCTVTLSFSDDEVADSAFKKITIDHARSGVADMWKFANV